MEVQSRIHLASVSSQAKDQVRVGAVSGLEWYLDRRQDKGGQRVVVNKEWDTHNIPLSQNNYMHFPLGN